MIMTIECSRCAGVFRIERLRERRSLITAGKGNAGCGAAADGVGGIGVLVRLNQCDVRQA